MNNVREIKGKLDIIYGKEEQDGGVEIHAVGADGAVDKDIDKDVFKSLISLNTSDIERSIFQLNKRALSRGAKIYDTKKILIQGLNSKLVYNFAESRSINKWTIAGIRYVYANVAGVEFIEIPTVIKYKLCYCSNDSVDCAIDKIDTIISEIKLLKSGDANLEVMTKSLDNTYSSTMYITSQEFVVNLGTSPERKYHSAEIFIEKWNVFAITNGKIYSDPMLLPQSIKDQFLAGEFVCGVDNTIKLTKSYDNQLETYSGSELASIEITRQLRNSENEINYGIVSNSLKATILNTNRKLDEGYLKDEVTMGRRVVAFAEINGVSQRLGTYYVSEWNIPMDNQWVELQANDRMYDFHNAMYNGFFPELDKVENMYDIVLSVIESINDHFLIALTNRIYSNDQLALLMAKFSPTSATYKYLKRQYDAGKKIVEGIDLELLDMQITNPYLERQPIWDVLENIAKCTLSQAYIDLLDRLIVHSDYNDLSTTIIDGKLYQRNINGEQATRAFARSRATRTTIVDTPEVVTASNCFEMAKPNYRKAYATEVTMDSTEYKFDAPNNNEEALITYYLNDMPIHEKKDGKYYYWLYVPKYVQSPNIVASAGISVENSSRVVIENNCWYFIVSITDPTGGLVSPELSCRILGRTISSSTTSVLARSAVSENKTPLAYSAGTLLNDDGVAHDLAARIAKLYSRGREVFETSWVGDLNYDIDKAISFVLPLQHSTMQCFRITSNVITIDKCLRQNINAMSYYQR